MFRIIQVLLITFLLLNGCSKESASPKSNSYYPLDVKSWVYQWQAFNSDSSVFGTDTVQFFNGTDTSAYNTKYRKIAAFNNSTTKLIRIDGSKYYERIRADYFSTAVNKTVMGYSDEFLFLDTDQQVGGSWTIEDDPYKKVYVVKSKNTTLTIAGKLYSDVIEVDVAYYYQEMGVDKLWLTTKHYYAKGFGEILNYLPYPLSGIYADTSFGLLGINR